MPKKLIEIAAEMVQTQVSLSPMSAADIASSLRQVFSTLQEMQKAEAGGMDIEVTQPAPEGVAATKLSPADSIQNDKVICLECGAEMKQLTSKHLSSHGISPKEYKKKYGFTMRTPLAAKSLVKARSKAAKKRGLPENLRKAIEARQQEKAAASTKVAKSTQAAAETVTASKQKPMLTPENSIQDDKVICLECGAEMSLLTVRHLVSHGMSLNEYKKKYGFSMTTPLAAKSLTEARSKTAQKRGLPDNLKKAMEARRQGKAEATTQEATETVTANKPKRTRLRKKKTA